VSDVDCAAGHAPCLHPVDAGGFDVEEAEVIYWGQCPTCSSKTAPATKVSSR
jgi:Fur family transcriptional regulator, stress-responsive regulator